MRIDDDELRELFKTSSEERLQAIDDGLLHLETHPEDVDRVEVLLREAHSLKGDSNMLGQTDLGQLAHHIEHILGQVHRGEMTFTSELADRLAKAMVAVRSLVAAAVTGDPPEIPAFYALAELMGGHDVTPSDRSAPASPLADSTTAAANGASPPADPPAAAQDAEAEADADAESEAEADAESSSFDPELAHVEHPASPLPVTATEQPLPAPAAARNAQRVDHTGYRIETVRVPTATLDHLMTQAGELTVTKIRVAHRLSEVEAMTNLWEDWNRDAFANRFLAEELSTTGGNVQPIQDFLSRTEAHLEQLGNLVQRLRGALAEDVTRLELVGNEIETGVRSLRLLPLATIFNLFPRMVRDLARQQGKQVRLVLQGGETLADKRILEEMKDPLMHMLRNAIDHGIESPSDRRRAGKPEEATITLRGSSTGNTIHIEVSDDGRGLDVDAIKESAMRKGLYPTEELEQLTPEQIQALILSPGFSTRLMVTEVSGRGVGLDVLRTNVERLNGHISVRSQPGEGCTWQIRLGTTLATAHVLIVSVQNHAYAIPVEWVLMARLVPPELVLTVNGQPTIEHDGQPVAVMALADLLQLPNADAAGTSTPGMRPCIMLQVGSDRLGIFVDDLLDEQDVVLKPQSRLLKRVRNIAGATILGTGDVCMVLNPPDLVQSLRQRSRSLVVPSAAPKAAPKQRSVLLVEDSIATRTQEKRILEGAGYQVVTAVDGQDGFNKLQLQAFDAVVSDVQMPRLSGLELTERIRQHQEYNEVPVILVTTLASDADRERGAAAGANAYITKGSFNQDLLLDTLERLI